jgi:hypothetical protein
LPQLHRASPSAALDKKCQDKITPPPLCQQANKHQKFSPPGSEIPALEPFRRIAYFMSVEIPSFLPYLAAFIFSLFICVILHLFVRGSSTLPGRSPRAPKKEDMDASNCTDLIRDQIALVQTFPHPSPQGKENAERLTELLLSARLYFPSSKSQLDAFASRLHEVYADEGLFLMALMDVRKWLNTHSKVELG